MSATRDRLDLLRDGLSPARKTRVLDIGASGAGASHYGPMLESGACEVFGFDAAEAEVTALDAHDAEDAAYRHAVLGDGSEQTFYNYNRSVFSSLYPVHRPSIDYLERFADGTQLVSTERVRTQRLDDLTHLPEIEFLQIDTQGAEEQILKNGRKVLSNAVAVISEVRFLRLYDGEPMMPRVCAELQDQGFSLHKFLEPKTVPVPFNGSQRVRMNRIASQFVDGDVVFLRDLSQPSALNDEKLKHLALLAASVFESHDIALKCIDLLVSRGSASPDLPDAYIDLLPPDCLHEPPQQSTIQKLTAFFWPFPRTASAHP